MDCPDYRLRLFLSVDLVGSTAFKANSNYSQPISGSASPAWVQQFRKFYREFPELIDAKYRELSTRETDEAASPVVWKTIGDEIIFCSRLRDIEHLADSVTAFLRALESFGQMLEKDGVPLNVKGAGWVAAFPAPNISIEIFQKGRVGSEEQASQSAVQHSEATELRADNEPHNFDFLGKGIDTGFRVAKNASSDRFVASVQLAYLLAKASQNQKFPSAFGYHGREVLKGVNGDRPYPVVSVDTERDTRRRILRDRERVLTQQHPVTALSLVDYLESFMEIEGIELPYLQSKSQPRSTEKLPEAYAIFQKAFEANQKEAAEREKSEQDSARPGDTGTESIPSNVDEWAKDAVRRHQMGTMTDKSTPSDGIRVGLIRNPRFLRPSAVQVPPVPSVPPKKS